MGWCAGCWVERRLDTQLRASSGHTCMVRDMQRLEVTDATEPDLEYRSIRYNLAVSKYFREDSARPEHRKLKRYRQNKLSLFGKVGWRRTITTGRYSSSLRRDKV